MGYDDVIKQKQDIVDGLIKNISEYKIQISNYQDQARIALSELNDAKNQRSDYLTILAGKKTELENKIVELQNQIQILTEESVKANENAAEHYKFLESELIKEYQKRGYELDQRDIYLNQKESSLSARENDLTQRASIAQQEIDKHNIAINNFYQKVSDIEKHHKQSIGDLEFDKKTFEEKMASLDMRELASDARESRLADRESRVAEREVAPAAILSRIDEANKLMTDAQQMKSDNDAREADLNRISVEQKAKMISISKQQDDLTARSLELDKREDNVKLLEAKNG